MAAAAAPANVIATGLTQWLLDAKPANEVTTTEIDRALQASWDNDETAHALDDVAKLQTNYPPLLIHVYDTRCLGFHQMSLQFAQSLPANFRPRVLLDLGCGTGETLAAVAEVAAARTPLTTVGFVDALEGMTMAADVKVAQRMGGPSARIPHESNPFALFRLTTFLRPDTTPIRQALQCLPHPPELVTAQRVLLNVPRVQHAHLLRAWMKLTAPGGKLIVDVSHHRRYPALEWLSPPIPNPGPEVYASQACCFQLTDEEPWELARRYARSLAAAAGLQIDNEPMPAQRPPLVTSKQGFMANWINARDPLASSRILTCLQRSFFLRDYGLEAPPHYHNQGFWHSIDFAAVVVVFSRGSRFEELG